MITERSKASALFSQGNKVTVLQYAVSQGAWSQNIKLNINNYERFLANSFYS